MCSSDLVVENRPGAGTVIGVDAAAKAPPDGYTFVGVANSFTVNATLVPKLPYDSLRDLQPVGLMARTANVLAAHPGVPATTLAELVELARRNPGKYTYASFGNGSSASQTPAFNNVPGGELNYLYQNGLPADRFNRALANSRFRLPDKRDNDSTDAPVLQQHSKDANLALTHQIGDAWFLEIGGDVNKTIDRRQNINDFRTVRIDINQTLPNGAPNPNYLLPYADGVEEWRWVKILNRAARANLAYRTDLGKWGNYLVNFNAMLTYKDTEAPNFQYSMRTLADPRLWNGSDDIIRVRHYWHEIGRAHV